MNTKEITLGSAVATVDLAIFNFFNNRPVSETHINDITYAVNNNIQIRDYLIGLPRGYSLEACSQFLSLLANSVDESKAYAFNTVIAMYQYEMGNSDTSAVLLAKALKAEPDYSLAGLINRVLDAGWPTDSFTTMRREMSGKVDEIIADGYDEIIWID